MTDAAMARPTGRVDMWYAGTAPQGRISVVFGLVLAIPQLIVLYFLFIALFVVVVIGWFAALFMGRLPDWAHTFICGVVRWSTRVGAYLLLLTDRYPPFSLDDKDYPARPILPGPGPLNRWAVLFRIILFVPAAVFVQIVQYGLTAPLLLVMWFVVLITGSMPRALYLAYAALLRYETRFHSWFSMLTSEYPWGMLGDRVQAAPPPSGPPPSVVPPGPPPAPPAAGATPPSYGQTPAQPPTPARPPTPAQPFSYPPASGAPDGPVQEQPSAAVPPEQPSAPGAPTPAPGWPPPMPAPPPAGVGAMPPPSSWERTAVPPPPGGELPPWGTLVLEGAARSWMIFAIVWGSIVLVGQSITQSALGRNQNNNNTGVVQYDAGHRVGFSAMPGSDGNDLVNQTNRMHGDP
jgi:Domain of unknown function (DUF4389)